MTSPNPASTGTRADTQAPPVLPSIPLSPDVARHDEASIGGLVKDATTHLSTLIRSEVELAKIEVTAEVKKGVKGSVFFAVALVVVLYSFFFFFFFVAELLQYLLLPWASYLVVFLLMLLIAGLSALLGWQRVRKIRAPERTISSVRDTAAALSKRGGSPAGERY